MGCVADEDGGRARNECCQARAAGLTDGEVRQRVLRVTGGGERVEDPGDERFDALVADVQRERDPVVGAERLDPPLEWRAPCVARPR